MLKEEKEFHVRKSFKQLKVCFRIQLPFPGSTFYYIETLANLVKV